jgi:hypothetical protein
MFEGLRNIDLDVKDYLELFNGAGGAIDSQRGVASVSWG